MVKKLVKGALELYLEVMLPLFDSYITIVILNQIKGNYRESESNSIEVAIKVLKDKNDSKEDFEREIEIISTFDHKNIIKLIGVVINDSNSIPYMVFEYMVCGDLAEVLRTKRLVKQIETTQDHDNLDKSLITHVIYIWFYRV